MTDSQTDGQPRHKQCFPALKEGTTRLKDDMERFSDRFTNKHSIKSDVNVMWTVFNDKCIQLMADHIPSKLTSNRFSQPWINRNIKKLSRRKKRAYNKARVSRKEPDWVQYKQLKNECQKESRKPTLHVIDLVCKDQMGNPKKHTALSRARSVMLMGLHRSHPIESTTVTV